MNVIISRKGFDLANGGCASPIFSDGTMISLPIPSGNALTTYAKIGAAGRNLGSIVDSLTHGRLGSASTAHLDPDLDRSAMARLPGWLPSFGQVGGRLTHLDKCGVNQGDLFLFFGWFRNVFDNNGSVQFAAQSVDQHVIFGWLQIGEILEVGSDVGAAISAKPWLAGHPHVVGSWGKKNRIYIASKHFEHPSFCEKERLPGGGVFRQIAKSRILTHSGQRNRSVWCLPSAFAPECGIAKLSCHEDIARWSESSIPGCVSLKSVSPGQEFVLAVRDESILMDWLHKVFI